MAAEPAVASAGASVVMLSPRPSPAADIRLKIAPLTFRAPVFAAPPAPPVAPAPVPEPVAEKAPTSRADSRAGAARAAEAALLSSASGAKIGASFEALAEIPAGARQGSGRAGGAGHAAADAEVLARRQFAESGRAPGARRNRAGRARPRLSLPPTSRKIIDLLIDLQPPLGFVAPTFDLSRSPSHKLGVAFAPNRP